MQEFLIFLSLGIGIFLWLFGEVTKNEGVLFASTLFFFLISVGLFTTGYDRFEGNATLVEAGNTTTVTQNSTAYPATLDANPSLYGFAWLCLILTFYLSARTWQERRARLYFSTE